MSATKLDREIKIVERDLIKDNSKIEFDFAEFFYTIAELFGLVLVLMVEPGPATMLEVWTVTIHAYSMVCVPVGNSVHVACVYASTYVRTTVSFRRSS